MAHTITLTDSMRSNLASLKSIQSQMDTTQERLSTGKEVNSAIDNASSFYQSRALTNRASDLDALLDSMGQGIQTIEAANEGIEAVTSFVEQLKSVAESAYALDPTSATYADQIASYEEQFNRIQEEITKLVNDASYQGINLLKGGRLTVTFNETRSNKFEILGDDILTEMDIQGVDTWALEETTQLTEDKTTEEIELKDDTGAGDEGTVPEGSIIYTNDDGTTTFVKTADGKYYELQGDGTADRVDAPGGTMVINKVPVESYGASIDATINSIAKATDYLRSYATELGNNYAIIQTRQNFTEALIDVLETGSDNLVLADMNEESANYLALQTRQQLAINSLSLASQSAQSILSLFQ